MINVALVQTKISSTQKNLQNILSYLDLAIQKKSDIVVFPEFALQYYTVPTEQPTFDMLRPFFEEIGDKCKNGNVYAIVPAVIR